MAPEPLLRCARPACQVPVPVRQGPGAPARYCSAGCRRAARVEFEELLLDLRRLMQTLDQYKRPVPPELFGRLLNAKTSEAVRRAQWLLGTDATAEQLRLALQDIVDSIEVPEP
jgi:hypothetical protein